MANSVLNQASFDIGFGSGRATTVRQVRVTYDTPVTEVTVYTPSTGNSAACLGLVHQHSAAHNLIMKTATTPILTMQLGANGQIVSPLSPRPLFVGNPSEAINFSMSSVLQSATTTMFFTEGAGGFRF